MTDIEGTLLTPAAHQKLADELDHLTTIGRDEVVARIAEARDHGDLKENSEYDTAKNDQGLMEARIRQLKHIIDHAQILEVEDSDVITVGSVATVIDDDGDEMDFFIAASENKIPGLLLASPDSPLGSALLGAKPGDDIDYEAPGGTFTYHVVSIRPYEN
ncbi:MAG: transcription elongation factor GreA [Acidimicrobiia bacterium]|nr:MAG: transcription elongation factor GreA [Acidimicrobiia bacterium]